MNKLKALYAVPLVMAAGAAHAAIDTSALDTTLSDANIVGGIVFGILIAIAGFKYVRKLL